MIGSARACTQRPVGLMRRLDMPRPKPSRRRRRRIGHSADWRTLSSVRGRLSARGLGHSAGWKRTSSP